MKIEIWSDIVCPFCFIGKHRLEKALEKFPENKFDIEWKSFQLNPQEITNPDLNATEHLAASKGWTQEQTQQAHQHVCAMGESCEIGFNFNSVKVVNSLDAHRLLHFAKANGKQNHLKEILFKSHFEEGKNTADKNVLAELGEKAGMRKEDCLQVLNGKEFLKEVFEDIQESKQLQIRGVPFFVFDRKYAVSGAQDVSVFEKTIQEILKLKND